MKKQEIQLFKETLERSKRIAIVFHFNPDGDAVGSALALYHYFKDDGYEVSVISLNPFPDFLHWMEGANDIIVAQEHLTTACKAIKEADILFVVDMNMPHRAGQDLERSIVKARGFKVLIDHHVQPDIECDVMYSTSKTSSAAELVYNFLYKYLTPKRKFTRPIAEALYVGIITDTGSVTYACDQPSTYDVLRKIIASGVNGESIHRKVYDNYTISRMKLLGLALSVSQQTGPPGQRFPNRRHRGVRQLRPLHPGHPLHRLLCGAGEPHPGLLPLDGPCGCQQVRPQILQRWRPPQRGRCLLQRHHRGGSQAL